MKKKLIIILLIGTAALGLIMAVLTGINTYREKNNINLQATGTASNLFKYVGTYEIVNFLREETTQKGLEILTERELFHMLRNTEVRNPIFFIDSYIGFTGLQAHRGGEEEVLVALNNLEDEKTVVVILSNFTFYVIAKGFNSEKDLPEFVKNWIYRKKTLGIQYLGQDYNIKYNFK